MIWLAIITALVVVWGEPEVRLQCLRKKTVNLQLYPRKLENCKWRCLYLYNNGSKFHWYIKNIVTSSRRDATWTLDDQIIYSGSSHGYTNNENYITPSHQTLSRIVNTVASRTLYIISKVQNTLYFHVKMVTNKGWCWTINPRPKIVKTFQIQVLYYIVPHNN